MTDAQRIALLSEALKGLVGEIDPHEQMTDAELSSHRPVIAARAALRAVNPNPKDELDRALERLVEELGRPVRRIDPRDLHPDDLTRDQVLDELVARWGYDRLDLIENRDEDQLRDLLLEERDDHARYENQKTGQ